MSTDREPEIRKIEHVGPRVETGPVQFGDDWPGVFIRGDNAFAFCMALEALLHHPNEPIMRAMVQGLRKTLASSDQTGKCRRALDAADRAAAEIGRTM